MPEDSDPSVLNIGDPNISLKFIGIFAIGIAITLGLLWLVVPNIKPREILFPKSRILTRLNQPTTTPSPTGPTATFMLHGVSKTISQSDRVQTKSAEQGIVVFQDGSTINLEPETQLILKNYSQQGEVWNIHIEQIHGKTLHKVRKLLSSSIYKITTKHGDILANGMTMQIDVNDYQTNIYTNDKPEITNPEKMKLFPAIPDAKIEGQ